MKRVLLQIGLLAKLCLASSNSTISTSPSSPSSSTNTTVVKDFTYTDTVGMNGQRLLNLTAFTKEMFWDEPPEGLYEVDVGLYKD